MKPIQFNFNGQVIEAELDSKVNKKDLYGYAKRIVQKDGVVLDRGYLTPDGNLISRKAIELEKCDPEGTPLEDILTEVNGEIATKLPSTFEQAQNLNKVDFKELIGFNVSDVYPITINNLEPGLYSTSFSYYASIARKEAFVLVKNDSAYLLAGESKATSWVGNIVYYDFFNTAEEEEDSEELDFDMI